MKDRSPEPSAAASVFAVRSATQDVLLPFFSFAMMALRLEAELLRLRDSRYVPLVLVDAAGLGGFTVVKLFTVDDTGIRGGGILSCFAAWLWSVVLSVAAGWLMLFLDWLRFQDKLNFRLRELMEDGVAGSSGLDRGGGDLGTGLTPF